MDRGSGAQMAELGGASGMLHNAAVLISVNRNQDEVLCSTEFWHPEKI